jgi:hypothetical protein
MRSHEPQTKHLQFDRQGQRISQDHQTRDNRYVAAFTLMKLPSARFMLARYYSPGS